MSLQLAPMLQKAVDDIERFKKMVTQDERSKIATIYEFFEAYEQMFQKRLKNKQVTPENPEGI